VHNENCDISNCHGKPCTFIFGCVGTLDEHMHLLLPALIRLFKVDASVDIRRAAIKTLTSLIPRVQVCFCACFYSPSIF